MNDEGNNENSNMNDDSTPSTAPDVMPSGGATLGQAAKQKAKNTVKKGWDSFKNAVGRGLKALWKFLPLQVKIIVIVILCILIVLAALLLMGMMEEGTSTVTTGVDNFMSDSKDIGKDAKSLYEDKASLIKVKLKDINSMYDKFIDDDKGGAETQTLMKYSIGTNDVKENNKEKRIVNVEDKLPLYKHILLTEKYNFNSVDWKKFSHNASAGEDIKDFKEDKELGLKYPDTTKNGSNDPKEIKLEKFIDLTLPYLQTWYIPLAMSNASVLNGTETDNNRAPAFSYNIIKEAYSNIVANWYELKKHTTVTRYYTYDEIKKHDMVTVEVIEREYENGAKNYSLRLGSSQTFEDSRIPKNTRTTSGIVGGTVDPMKEEAVSQKDEYSSHLYIKEADVFDAKIVNQFNYQVYSDADAAKRINADSTNESTATYAKTMSTEDINKKGENAMYGLTVDSNGNISGANLDKVSRFGNAIPQNDPTNTTKRTTAYSYNVTFKQYTDYENGLEHTVTRIWKDKLSQTGSETSDYTIDDLIMYNQSDKRKEKVDATDLCGEDYSSSSSSGTSTGTKSGKYYTSLKKNDGLNRIDFMNSNPDIFHRYIREGGEYYEYVGYSRSKLSLSYWNLKTMLQKVYDKKGSLPWAYGKTLGFENIYSSSGSSSSSTGNSSGRGLQAMVDKAIELSKANGGEGVWHYCWGAASGFTHSNARFTFSTIDEMNKYIEIGKSAGLDCSAFVLSMYKAYTGADIDPGGAGATMVSYARSHNGQSLPGSENVTIEYHDSLDDNIQVGDVLFMTGHVGIYAGRDNSGNIMTVDHGGSGSSINCSLADGSNWTGPKYRNGSWFEGYIHYDGLSSGGASGLNLSVEETKDFAVMIYGEAGGNSYELQVACAAAAINQYKAAVAEGKNVDFLKDFIHNTSNFNGYGAAQGHQVSENDSVYKAAVDALNGEDPTGGALYFYAPAAMDPPGSTSEWHESLTYLCTIDGVRFFKP